MTKSSQRWTYAVTGHQSVGPMICSVCQDRIIGGEFRFRIDERDTYVCEHRSCSPEIDWVDFDASEIKLREEAKAYQEKRLAAYREFVKLYGSPIDLINIDFDE